MNATQQLHELGQSLWLDNITHALLASGTLARYIREFAVTGLTSNPTIFDHAIKDGGFYDDAIRRRSLAGKPDEALFFEMAIEDLVQAGGTGLHARSVLQVELPAIAVPAFVLDDRDDVDAEATAHERHRRGLPLNLEILYGLVGIDFE